MRILAFDRKWNKLDNNTFSTFRFPRLDWDWQVGEHVQIVLHPRSKEREVLGIARIVGKELRELDPYFTDGKVVTPIGVALVTDEEAIEDGFTGREDMVRRMQKKHGLDYSSLMNKLSLQWVKRGKKGV